MKTTLQKWGNSQGVRIPKALLEELRLNAGAEVSLAIADDEPAIILRPIRPGKPVRGRHRIEDLAARMPRNYKAEEFGPGLPAGREVW